MLNLQNQGFKDFEMIKELGSGSFGKVYLAKKKDTGILCAIKSVLMTRLNQKQKENTLNEIRLLASIHIPNVISYEGSFYNHETQSLCLIMEYADGGDLEDKINQKFKINEQEGFQENFIWKVAFEILQGLKLLHKNKIAHRDIKSANVFFVNGIAKLGDFNVSKVLENGMCSTHTGTPYYTSPEIWKGETYGRKCDIWSVGCLLYQMCALQPPFRAKDFPGLFRKVIAGQYDTIPSKYSSELAEMIRMCLNVDENMRPDACELLQTPILAGMEANLQKLDDQDSKIELLDPIKCPKVLRFLNNKLPKTKSQSKKPLNFTLKKQLKLQGSQSAILQNINTSKAKSQKIINFKKDALNSKSFGPKLSSKNQIAVCSTSTSNQQTVLKFNYKKIRGSQKKIGGSKKCIKIGEKQNSLKLIAHQ